MLWNNNKASMLWFLLLMLQTTCFFHNNIIILVHFLEPFVWPTIVFGISINQKFILVRIVSPLPPIYWETITITINSNEKEATCVFTAHMAFKATRVNLKITHVSLWLPVRSKEFRPCLPLSLQLQSYTKLKWTVIEISTFSVCYVLVQSVEWEATDMSKIYIPISSHSPFESNIVNPCFTVTEKHKHI